MFCPHCGKKIAKGSKFCKYCGYKISNVASPTSNKISNSLNSHPKAKSWVKKIFGHKYIDIAVVLIILIAGGGYRYYADHCLPRYLANKTMDFGSGEDKVKYHFGHRTIIFNPEDGFAKQHYNIDKVKRSNWGKHLKVYVTGDNNSAKASSFSIKKNDSSIWVKPNGEDPF